MAQQYLATPKTYPDRFETRFAALASSLGWEATKQGFPDFVCYGENDQFVLVEVKPPGRSLGPAERRLMLALSRIGIKCFLSDGDTLKPVGLDVETK